VGGVRQRRGDALGSGGRGRRLGHRVAVEITQKGSVVRVTGAGEPIVIERKGHKGAAWLLDLAEAERLADEREG
jgi:hypothetical protein